MAASARAKVSPTEAEFQEAKAWHKNILIYIKAKIPPIKTVKIGVQKLLEKIRNPKAGLQLPSIQGSALTYRHRP